MKRKSQNITFMLHKNRSTKGKRADKIQLNLSVMLRDKRTSKLMLQHDFKNAYVIWVLWASRAQNTRAPSPHWLSPSGDSLPSTCSLGPWSPVDRTLASMAGDAQRCWLFFLSGVGEGELSHTKDVVIWMLLSPQTCAVQKESHWSQEALEMQLIQTEKCQCVKCSLGFKERLSRKNPKYLGTIFFILITCQRECSGYWTKLVSPGLCLFDLFYFSKCGY